MHNVYLFQPQYGINFKNTTNYWLPYSAACLWSYAQQFDDITENYELKEIIFKRETHEDVLARLDNPKICGFSCYAWNYRYSILLAEKIKKAYPECKIVFGGPQVNKKMLKDFWWLDSIVTTEGEEIFVKLLRDALEGKDLLPVYSGGRMKNLEIPSPYAAGIFDKIVAEHPNAVWATTLETSRGCPFSCTFCDWGGVTYSKVYKFDEQRVIDDFTWIVNNKVAYVFIADANFGVFKERDLNLARKMSELAENSILDVIGIEYAKNSTDVIFDIAKAIGKRSKGLTVSVQSMNDATLEDIKRKNLEINRMEHVLTMAEKHDIPAYSEVILGLPNETLDSFKDGLCKLLEVGQHSSIDLWFAQLIVNSELASAESRKKYDIKSVQALDYVSLYNSTFHDAYPETIEIVNHTNTMTTDELIEAYMYGWMIIHFHTNGYTQIFARYMNGFEDIMYREFYDRLFEMIQDDEILGEHFRELKNIVGHYLRTGELLQGDRIRGHAIHTFSWKFIYENRQHIFDIGKKLVEEFTFDGDEIYNLQRHFIYDEKFIYPEILKDFTFNLYEKTVQRTSYRVVNKLQNMKNIDFYSLRRRGAIKNQFITFS